VQRMGKSAARRWTVDVLEKLTVGRQSSCLNCHNEKFISEVSQIDFQRAPEEARARAVDLGKPQAPVTEAGAEPGRTEGKEL